METAEQLDQRMRRASFMLKAMLQRWEDLGESAKESTTYAMTKNALDALEGRFDEMETINIDIDDDTFLQVAMMAHEKDITFNQMIEWALRKQLDHEDEMKKILKRDTEESSDA